VTGVLAEVGYQSNWVEVLSAPFMRNAFTGGILVALAGGMIGYFVVVRGGEFAAHALGHIGFPAPPVRCSSASHRRSGSVCSAWPGPW
jgi:hypothetical protein